MQMPHFSFMFLTVFNSKYQTNTDLETKLYKNCKTSLLYDSTVGTVFLGYQDVPPV